MLHILVFLASVVCQHLFAEPQILNLAHFSLENSTEASLLSLQGQIIQVRGFWYPLSPQEGILAPQPHLKSCCVRAPTTIQQQLLVRGAVDSLSAQRAVTVEGMFKIDPRYNSKGELIQLFILEQARERSQTSLYFSPMILGIVMVLLSVGFIFFKRKFGPSTKAGARL